MTRVLTDKRPLSALRFEKIDQKIETAARMYAFWMQAYIDLTALNNRSYLSTKYAEGL